MKNLKTSALLYGIVAVLFYINAISNFISDDNMGVVYFCIGTTFLCLAIDENKDDDDDKKHKQ